MGRQEIPDQMVLGIPQMFSALDLFLPSVLNLLVLFQTT
jgi:hypothetical protein